MSDGEARVTFAEWIASPEGLAKLAEGMRARLEGTYQPTPFELALGETVREFRRLHELNQAADPIVRPYLARAGWIITGDFPSQDISALADLISAGDLAGAEARMTDHARSRVDPLEAKIAKHWPERAPIVRDALAAHREQRYALSIPALLAQADGITAEGLGVGPYVKAHGAPRARRAYRSRLPPAAADEHPWTLMFGPLDVVSSWNEDVDPWREKRTSDLHYGSLNRHGVMHGLDVTYPSEGNSLRAMLLLEYASELADWLDWESSKS